MQAEPNPGRLESVAAHPLAELLDCPPETAKLLNGCAEYLNCEPGQVVFHQDTDSKGLYIVVTGQFARSSERMKTRLTLGPVRAGELVELAAVLGDGRHTYSLRAITPATMLLLPQDALNQVFESYPPLRMHLLEELAREVSRAYFASSLNRRMPTRRQNGDAHPE